MNEASADFKKNNVFTAYRIKALLVLSVIILCLMCLIFGNLFAKNQSDISFTVTFSGIKILELLFKKGSFERYDNWENLITVKYPMIICYGTAALFFLIVAVLAIYIIRYTAGKRKNENLWSNLAAWSAITASLLTVVFYVYMLFCKITVYNYYGEEKYLYNIFEIKAIFLVIAMLLFMVGIIELKFKIETVTTVKRFLPIYGFMVIPLILILVFNFYPVLLQTVLSFKDFILSDGVWGSKWVGFKQFKLIFTDNEMLMVIGRTLYISVLRLIVGILPPLILSICLYDLKSARLRSIFQNIVYIPHFFSWVVVYAITYSLLSPEGLVNSLFKTSVDYMVSEKYFMPIVIISAVWKELGWGTILYLAALSGIDTALFEAAKIDGASPMQRIWNITLPGIKNMIIFLTIMSIGNILKGAGGEQLLLFYSAPTKDQALVIDTWLVWYGMKKLEYSLGAAMSFFQSAIGMIMVLTCNYISKKTCDVGIW